MRRASAVLLVPSPSPSPLAAAGCGDGPVAERDRRAGDVRPAAPSSAAATGTGGRGGTSTGVKTYLTDHTDALAGSARDLPRRGQPGVLRPGEGRRLRLRELWQAEQRGAVVPMLTGLQETYRASNPQYEQMEGVVAGVPSLSRFDVILDAGASAADDPENAVPFDLTLPDGRVLEKPGNLFYMAETASSARARTSRPRTCSPTSTATARSSSARCCPTPTCCSARRRPSTATRRSCSAGRRVGAERGGRLHGPRRDDPDHERVLRELEELALRGRRRRHASRRSRRRRACPTSRTSWPASRSSTPASSRAWPAPTRRRPTRSAPGLGELHRLHRAACATRRPAAACSSRRRPTSSAPTSRPARPASPARSRRSAAQLGVEISA